MRAEQLRCSYWTARNLVITRQLPSVRLPAPPRRRTFRKGRLAGQTQIIKAGRVLVTADDLAAFVAAHRVGGAEEVGARSGDLQAPMAKDGSAPAFRRRGKNAPTR